MAVVLGGRDGGVMGSVVGCVGGGEGEGDRDGVGLMAGLVVRGATGGCACRVTGAAGDGTTTGNAAGEDTSGAWLPWTAVPRDAGADGAAAPSWTMSRTMSRFRIVSGCRYPAPPAKEMIPPARPRASPIVRTVAQSGPRRRFRFCTAGGRITGSGPVSSCGRYGEFTRCSARKIGRAH